MSLRPRGPFPRCQGPAAYQAAFLVRTDSRTSRSEPYRSRPGVQMALLSGTSLGRVGIGLSSEGYFVHFFDGSFLNIQTKSRIIFKFFFST